MNKTYYIFAVILLGVLVTAPLPAPAADDTESETEDTDSEVTNGWWEAEIIDRDDNSWNVQAKDINDFNERDCLDDIRINVKVNAGENAIGDERPTYLVAGNNCDDSFTSCTVLLNHTSADNTWIWKNIRIRTIFDGTTCTEADTVELWIAQLKNDNDYVKNSGDAISKMMTLNLDVDGPTTEPKNIGVKVGNKNIELSWDKLEDANVAGYVAIYWSTQDGPVSTDAAMELIDTDTGTDTSTETTTETATATETETDTGTDTGADTGTDTPVASGSCPAGGFEKGDEIDPLLLSGSEKALATGSAALKNLKITGLVNGRSYKVAVVSVDASGNPSEISETRCASPSATIPFGDALGDSVDGGYCFIATAAFGSYDHPTVKVLRQFRDQFLAKAPGGNAFISAYYSAGPSMARFLNSQDDGLKTDTRNLLTLSAGFATLLLAIGPAPILIALLLSILIGLLAGILAPKIVRRN